MNTLLYQLAVYVHVIGAIFLTGYALFWVIVTLKKRTESEGEDSVQAVLRRATWPPPPIPSPVRLHLTEIGMGSLIALAATGFLAYALREWAGLGSEGFELASGFGAKLALVGLSFVVLSVAGKSSRPLWLRLFLLLTLAVVAVSAIVAR